MVFWYPKDCQVTTLKADSFPAFIEKHDRVFIHFAASWNGYDRMLMPHVAQAAEALGDKMHFAAMDVDIKENWPLLAQLGMSNVPYFEYYESGKRVEAGTGYDVAMKQLALLTKKIP
jgi:thiol-disulfide isomerase/thioredoxin